MAKFRYQGVGIPGGYEPGEQAPMDVRTVVDTLAQLYRIQTPFPGMEVFVLGTPVVVGGIETFPNLQKKRCIVVRNPSPDGNLPTTFAQDWVDAGFSSAGSSFKGPVDFNEDGGSGNTVAVPNLADAGLRASLNPGDFFKVRTVGGAISLDGITEMQVNDTLFWSGTKFDRFQNTNPAAISPLYRDTEAQRFLDDVKRVFRQDTFRRWQPGTDYQAFETVSRVYETGGFYVVDIWQAQRDISAAQAALPTSDLGTPFEDEGTWLLVATTNAQRLAGMPKQADATGKRAAGVFKPAATSPNAFLSPEEVDARIKQEVAAAGGGRAIIGGDAFTFVTADPTEQPLN